MYSLRVLTNPIDSVELFFETFLVALCWFTLAYLFLVYEVHNIGLIGILPTHLNINFSWVLFVSSAWIVFTAGNLRAVFLFSFIALLTIGVALVEVSYAHFFNKLRRDFFLLTEEESKEPSWFMILKPFWSLTALFPLYLWSHSSSVLLNSWAYTLLSLAYNSHLAYQSLWYSRKYRRDRKKIKGIFEAPIRIRRYWYLTIKLWTRQSLAWLGVPFKQHPQFKPSNTFLGCLTGRIRRTFHRGLGLFGLANLWKILKVWGSICINKLKDLWNRRPSLIQTFVDVFQPEAPVYIRRGFVITPPPRRQRLINLFSDMEAFASRGSSLLVFMFLIWSFFARILLVFCLLALV